MASELLKEIIDQYVSSDDIVKVTLPSSDPKKPIVIRFKIITDLVDTNKLIRKTGEWITERNALHEKGILPPDFAKVFFNDPEILGQVYMLSELAVDDEWRSTTTWMTLARKAGPVFSGIFEVVDRSAIKNRKQLLSAVIEQEKKDLKTPTIEQE